MIFQLSKVEKYKISIHLITKKDENKMIKGLKDFKKYFNKIFSNNKNYLINYLLNNFEWERLKKFIVEKQLSPWDIHPHNIITNKNSVRGIIDLTGIKYMPIGYALSYGLVAIKTIFYKTKNKKKKIIIFLQNHIFIK